jgi:hypothetical protein
MPDAIPRFEAESLPREWCCEPAQLPAFLKKTAKLPCCTRHGLTTQLDKPFNAAKVDFASKTQSWKLSWPVRTMCAIMRLNSPEL